MTVFAAVSLTRSGRGPRAIAATALRIAAVLALTLGAACSEVSDPEREIRSWLAEAEAELEDRERRALMGRVAEGYTDARSNDREAFGGLLRYYFLRQPNLSVVTGIDAIEVFAGTAAEVTLKAATAAHGGSAGLEADAWRVVLSLEKRDGDWLLTSAKWGRLGEEPR